MLLKYCTIPFHSQRFQFLEMSPDVNSINTNSTCFCDDLHKSSRIYFFEMYVIINYMFVLVNKKDSFQKDILIKY